MPNKDRTSADGIIAGLTTKSDKIRTLARAGFLRADIARLLGVRYQHVRNVLLGSGIEGGLSRGDQPGPTHRSSVASKTAGGADPALQRRAGASEFTGALVLISCVKSKRSRPAPARDLYTSPLFTMARDLAERGGSEYRILSALHGLVDPAQVIEPYELTLNNMGVAARRTWADRVLGELLPLAKTHRKIIFLAGHRYREFLIRPLRQGGVEVDIPMEGLALGQQLSWLKAQL